MPKKGSIFIIRAFIIQNPLIGKEAEKRKLCPVRLFQREAGGKKPKLRSRDRAQRRGGERGCREIKINLPKGKPGKTIFPLLMRTRRNRGRSCVSITENATVLPIPKEKK